MYHCVCTTVLCCVVVCRVCNKDLVTLSKLQREVKRRDAVGVSHINEIK